MDKLLANMYRLPPILLSLVVLVFLLDLHSKKISYVQFPFYDFKKLLNFLIIFTSALILSTSRFILDLFGYSDITHLINSIIALLGYVSLTYFIFRLRKIILQNSEKSIDEIKDRRIQKPKTENKKKNPIVAILIGISAFLLFIFMIWFFVTSMMTNSWPYQQALETVSTDMEMDEILGFPITQKGIMVGSINISGTSGDADLMIPLKGSQGKGKLYVLAKRTNGEWSFLRLEFKEKGSSVTIDLLN